MPKLNISDIGELSFVSVRWLESVSEDTDYENRQPCVFRARIDHSVTHMATPQACVPAISTTVCEMTPDHFVQLS